MKFNSIINIWRNWTNPKCFGTNEYEGKSNICSNCKRRFSCKKKAFGGVTYAKGNKESKE